jgi:type IV secretion system protein VirB5
VVDVGAINQLVQEITILREQLATARSDLAQAQQAYQSITGDRGMEALLSGTVRNYLPPDWSGLLASVNGLANGYGVLSAQLNTALRANAILTPAQIARLSAQEQAELQSRRNAAAMMQATSQQALQTSSQRFASLQQLISTIRSATDSKGIMDLQARIAAEQAMLENEQTKVHTLNQTLEAEERARQQRAPELAIANFGSLRNSPPIGLN